VNEELLLGKSRSEKNVIELSKRICDKLSIKDFDPQFNISADHIVKSRNGITIPQSCNYFQPYLEFPSYEERDAFAHISIFLF
jgi:hypothetical protein